MESKQIWLDTPFSFAVQSFQPPHHPSGMKAMLEHSQQNYGPLPAELRCHHVRSGTYSHHIHRESSSRLPRKGHHLNHPRRNTNTQPLQPKPVNVNLKTPTPAIKGLNPISPFIVEFRKSKGEKSFNGHTVCPRVTSSTHRAALGWSKCHAGKSSELEENMSHNPDHVSDHP